MRLRHIEVFHAVMLSGTVSAAARLLSLTQPAVTQYLNSLELQLGYSLFKRVRGRLAPTSEAHALYVEVEKLNVQLDAVKLIARNLKRGEHDRLRILAAPALALELVPRALAAFFADHPGARITVKTDYSSQVLAGLALHKADVGIVYHSAAHPLVQENILGEGVLVCAVPPGTFAGRESIDIEEIAGKTLFVPEHHHPLGNLFAQLCRERGVEVSSHLEIEQLHVALNLVTAGLGIAVVDSFTALSADPRRIHVVRIEPELRFKVCAAYPASAMHPHLAEKFAAHVRAVIAGDADRAAG